MNNQKDKQALIFSAPDSSFRDAIVLGQGLPPEKDGQPTQYKWKESLHLGMFQDADGIQHEVTPNRIDLVLNDYRRAFEKGYRPPIMLGHPRKGAPKDPTKSRGFIVDARKNEKGNLELLHQLVGEDAILDAARNKTSICILPDVTDEHGSHYEQFIDHQALVPDPQLNSLNDFVPALAASRGATASAVVLTLAASQKEESDMDLTKLREAIGATKEVSDELVLTQAIAKLGEGKTALELSRTKESEVATLRTRAETAETKLAQAESKALELSRGSMDESTLNREANYAARDLDYILRDGKCTPQQVAIVKDWMIKDGKPTPNAALVLSRGTGGDSPIELVKKVLELNKPLIGTVTGLQLTDPNVEQNSEVAKAIAKERQDAEEWRKGELQARGISTAA
jgi:hypothetical protein